MIGKPEKDGHYFTICAPRQTGKTWLMRQVKKQIEEKYADRFVVDEMSMQGVVFENDEEPQKTLLKWIPHLIRDTFNLTIDTPHDWKEWIDIFHKSIHGCSGYLGDRV